MNVIQSMTSFAGILEDDYRKLTLANLSLVATLSAADMAIKNQYFQDMIKNRYYITCFVTANDLSIIHEKCFI